MPTSQNDERKFEIVSSTPLYKGFFAMSRYRLRHTRFAGGWSGEMEREIFLRGEAVMVLPYDPASDSVVLIEQFRPGPAIAGQDAWQIETVAGIIDTAETAEAVARREAVEEANIVLGRVHLVMPHYLPSPGGCTESLALYVGEVDSVGVGGLHGLDSEHEDIRAFTLTLDDALTLVDAGKVQNGATMVLLLWLGRHRARLRAEWGAAP